MFIITINCPYTLHSFLSIPLMLSVQCDPPIHASFPSVHAFIMLEGTMNLTGETQPMVEQLMMMKRMQVNFSFETDVFFNLPLIMWPVGRIHH